MTNDTPHEYYSSYETCRNRWFDMYDEPLQNEDIHLSINNLEEKE